MTWTDVLIIALGAGFYGFMLGYLVTVRFPLRDEVQEARDAYEAAQEEAPDGHA